jgi:hypothetical protein
MREGPSPPDRELDKLSTASREGVNSSMEQEEDGKKSQAWPRGPIVHRVSIALMLLSMYVNIIMPSSILNPLSYLFICFRRINHMAINHLHSSSDATSLYVTVASGTTIKETFYRYDLIIKIHCISDTFIFLILNIFFYTSRGKVRAEYKSRRLIWRFKVIFWQKELWIKMLSWRILRKFGSHLCYIGSLMAGKTLCRFAHISVVFLGISQTFLDFFIANKSLISFEQIVVA